jgi:hypothetical protein
MGEHFDLISRDGWSARFWECPKGRTYVAIKRAKNGNIAFYRLNCGLNGFVSITDDQEVFPRELSYVPASNIPARYNAWTRAAAAAFLNTAVAVNEA